LIVTIVPPPEKRLNATPSLRTWTISTPGEDAVAVADHGCAPDKRLRRLVEDDDHDRDRGRSQPWDINRRLGVHQPPDDLQQEDRDDRAEVQRAERGMKRRKIDRYGSQTARRKPSSALDQPREARAPEREEQRAQDVGDDQERVDDEDAYT
jgi:hypothetical protein